MLDALLLLGGGQVIKLAAREGHGLGALVLNSGHDGGKVIVGEDHLGGGLSYRVPISAFSRAGGSLAPSRWTQTGRTSDVGRWTLDVGQDRRRTSQVTTSSPLVVAAYCPPHVSL